MSCDICNDKFLREEINEYYYNLEKDYIIVKCKNCGYHMVIPKILININKIYITNQIIDVTCSQPIMIEYCPNCK